jgi:hypothetical protein
MASTRSASQRARGRRMWSPTCGDTAHRCGETRRDVECGSVVCLKLYACRAHDGGLLHTARIVSFL